MILASPAPDIPWERVLEVLRQAGLTAAVLAGAAVAAFLAHWLLVLLLRRVARRTSTVVDDSLVRHWNWPSRLAATLLAVLFAVPWTAMTEKTSERVRHIAGVLLIVIVYWMLARAVYVVRDFLLSRYDVEAEDNLLARKIHTQLKVLARVAYLTAGVLALGTALMTFDSVRELGASILASAGIAGLVLGFAAQRTLGAVIAGLQIALTQPIRIDDVVIVEGEWGRIEEITLTYVVVKIWDLRRLILPITYFIEKPFQNWTRVTADLLGTVHLHLDYRVPVERIREETKAILDAAPEWDGKVWNVQVTGASDRALEVRALMSASDASKAWNLRCHVREKLVSWLQENHPASLPLLRVESRGGKESAPTGESREGAGQDPPARPLKSED